MGLPVGDCGMLKRRSLDVTVRLEVAGQTSVAACCGRSILTALGEVEALNGGAFLIVVPGFDHDEGQGMSRIEVAVVQVQRIFECLAAARLHVAVQSPFRA